MISQIKKEDKPATVRGETLICIAVELASAVRQMGKAFDEAALGAKALLEYKRRMAHENQLSF